MEGRKEKVLFGGGDEKKEEREQKGKCHGQDTSIEVCGENEWATLYIFYVSG